MEKVQRISRATVMGISLGISIVTVVLYWTRSFDGLEKTADDLRTKIRYGLKTGEWRQWFDANAKIPSFPVSDEVVLTAIEEKHSLNPSFSKYSDRWGMGGWLTREHYYAPYGYMVKYYKPTVMAYDILFNPARTDIRTQEEGQQILADIEKRLAQQGGQISGIIADPEFQMDLLSLLDENCNYTFASRQIDLLSDEQTSLVLAYSLNRSEEDSSKTFSVKNTIDQVNLDWLDENVIPDRLLKNFPPDFPLTDGANLPMKILRDGGAALGYISTPRDEDGLVRRVPLVNAYQDPRKTGKICVVPSFALQVLLKHLKINLSDLKPETKDKGLEVKFGDEIHVWNESKSYHIPINRNGVMALNFEGKIGDYLQIPYVDITRFGDLFEAVAIGQTLPDMTDVGLKEAHHVLDAISNRIWITGVTATGTDTGPCPIAKIVPYVFVHMTALDNILRNAYLLPLGKWPTTFLLFACPLLVGLCSLHPRARVSTIAVITLFAMVEGVSYLMFHYNFAILPVVLPAFAIPVTFGFNSIYLYQVERKGRMEVRKKFSAMVSPKVLQYMEEHPESLSGERREATMFFSDVAGFTSISESITPAKLSQILNDYLTPMSRIILNHDGYVNKYAGDGIMAVWGVPYPSQDHAIQSCLAALEQQRVIRELQPVFMEKYQVKLHVRMGIHTGEVSAGNMGSAERYEYTVMGDAVNFAARLEPSNKEYGTLIMIGVRTYEEAKDRIIARRLEPLVVYGKKEPVLAYDLLARKEDQTPELTRALECWESGMDLFLQRKWDEAEAMFKEVPNHLPDDYASKVMVERIREYRQNPPSADWAGEYVRKGK